MTRLEGFVVELLVTGLSEMTLGSRREQISSLRRCSNHLHPGPGQLPHWEKARESQSLQQRPPRPSIWQSVNWERKESTRSHFRLELCRDGHVWTMNARVSGSARCVSNWRDFYDCSWTHCLFICTLGFMYILFCVSVYVFYVFMHISYFRFLFTSLIYLDVFSLFIYLFIFLLLHTCICKTFIKWLLHSIQCDTLALQITCTEVCSSRFKSEP